MVQPVEIYNPDLPVLISIHLMLWFNNSLNVLIYFLKHFNTSYVMVQRKNIKVFKGRLDNFNTSYVMVQQWPSARRKNFKYISIHLMLWFNNERAFKRYGRIGFQYILCYGSTFRKID